MEIHRGITRTVLLASRWAIKFPSFRAYGDGARGVVWSITRGIQANLSEITWTGSPGVCPVAWSLAGLVNVYPRCEPVLTEPTEEEYSATGVLGPTDRKASNVGWLKGRLVWNDCRCRKE